MARKKVEYVGMTFEHPVYGKYTIIEDLGMIHKLPSGRKVRKVVVRFENTGYTVETFPSSALTGDIKDPYAPVMFGVGYFGEPVGYSVHEHERIYRIWNSMIHRNYDVNNPGYRDYGAKGVRVDPRWHSFANFFADFHNLPGYNEWLVNPDYELDKDQLQANIPIDQRVYSPETCQLIPGSVNIIAKHMRKVDTNEIPYVGVTSGGKNIYKSIFSSTMYGKPEDRYRLLYAKFSDPLSAAIYHDVYTQVYADMHPNNVPIDPISVRRAQDNRLDKEYKELYHLNNKEKTNG